MLQIAANSFSNLEMYEPVEEIHEERIASTTYFSSLPTKSGYARGMRGSCIRDDFLFSEDLKFCDSPRKRRLNYAGFPSHPALRTRFSFNHFKRRNIVVRINDVRVCPQLSVVSKNRYLR